MCVCVCVCVHLSLSLSLSRCISGRTCSAVATIPPLLALKVLCSY